MFIANNSGTITFANDTWYDISRVPKNASMADTWMNAVKPEDMDFKSGLAEANVNDSPSLLLSRNLSSICEKNFKIPKSRVQKSKPPRLSP